ncbi:hypothetical protein [Geomicrobium sediminis]|uniref:Uncharacterized protein n=1 Tax=Geomicrobium sediminis TaxID=1347788 RepID=A0ABS2PF62_9BACL|nr:hypothetical protein [Geomicrobium sediminis]MBM7634072.1 hypothetical protein [Geomicrobium sediminis]
MAIKLVSKGKQTINVTDKAYSVIYAPLGYKEVKKNGKGKTEQGKQEGHEAKKQSEDKGKETGGESKE